MTTSTLTRADLNDPQLREEVQKLVPGARDTHGDTTEVSFFLQVQGKDSEELGPKLSELIRELSQPFVPVQIWPLSPKREYSPRPPPRKNWVSPGRLS